MLSSLLFLGIHFLGLCPGVIEYSEKNSNRYTSVQSNWYSVQISVQISVHCTGMLSWFSISIPYHDTMHGTDGTVTAAK